MLRNWFFAESSEKKFVPVQNDVEDIARVEAYKAKKEAERKAKQAHRDHLENIRAEALELHKNMPSIYDRTDCKIDPRTRVFDNHAHKDVLKVREKMQKAQENWPTHGKLASLKFC